MPTSQMFPFHLLEQRGVLPIKAGVVNFAIGDPSEKTSNSWKIWERNGSVYIACRDNFQQAKVSLHPNHWRIAFTKESNLKMNGDDRVWEEWDISKAQIENAKIVFRLFFAASDLAVLPEFRNGRKWKNMIFIEPPPQGKLLAISVFLLTKDLEVKHETEPSFCLASFNLHENGYVKIIAHSEPEGIIPDLKTKAVDETLKQCQEKNVKIPGGAYAYFFGHLADESRFLLTTTIIISQ